MEYSVEELSKLSGVSVRTLHYYDEIFLLTPMARVGNGRRIYGRDELLRLQEILYFKEMGFSLKKIESILNAKQLSKVEMLTAQKKIIEKEVSRYKKIIQSIEITINHYKGLKMSDKQLVSNFDEFKNKTSDAIKVMEEKFSSETLDAYKAKTQSMSTEELMKYGQKSTELLSRIVNAMKEKLDPASDEVQKLMQDYFDGYLIPPSKEEFQIGRELLMDEQSRWLYATYGPDFPKFLYDATGIFALHHFD